MGDDGAAELWPVEHFTAAVRQVGDVTVVTLAGELDISSTGPLARRLADVVERADGGAIEVDCTALSFIDVTGLTLLLELANRRGPRPVLRNPSPTLQKMLALTWAVELFDVAEGQADRVV